MDATRVTTLLDRLRGGDESAGGALFELVQTELHARARRLLRGTPAHTLQATALVNEAWLKVAGAGSRAADRAHFLAVASSAMRQVLVDHARAKAALKRDGGGERLVLDEALAIYAERVPDVLELDDELRRLAELDPRAARVVELRFFGGLSIADTAAALDVGHATVERDWNTARAWLAARLGAGGATGGEDAGDAT